MKFPTILSKIFYDRCLSARLYRVIFCYHIKWRVPFGWVAWWRGCHYCMYVYVCIDDLCMYLVWIDAWCLINDIACLIQNYMYTFIHHQIPATVSPSSVTAASTAGHHTPRWCLRAVTISDPNWASRKLNCSAIARVRLLMVVILVGVAVHGARSHLVSNFRTRIN